MIFGAALSSDGHEQGVKVFELSHVAQRREADEERDGAVKKPRVVWSVEMHQQFVNAVNQLGIDSKCPPVVLVAQRALCMMPCMLPLVAVWLLLLGCFFARGSDYDRLTA